MHLIFEMIREKKETVSLLVLVAYLGIFFANVYHYHTVNLNLDSPTEFRTETKYKSSTHNVDNCPVNSTFNQIHTSFINYLSFDPSDFYSNKNFLFESSLKITNTSLINFQLRAPPLLHS